MKHVSYIWVVSTLILMSNPLLGDSVVQRGISKPRECNVLSGGVDGLYVEFLGETSSTLLPWSSVASISTETPRPALDPFLIQGDAVSRAKRRFLRGDLLLAEPSFASLFRELDGASSVDARIVAEGLLRCYVATGKLREALQPWLETVRLDELGVETPYTNLVPILDQSTKLCSNLPPVWAIDAYTSPILDSYSKSKLQTTSSIAKLLRTKGSDVVRSPVQGVTDSEFLLQIIAVASGETIQIPISELSKENYPSWKRIWREYFNALQILHDEDDATKTNAMLLLAGISAEDKGVVPWISGAAMLRLAQELQGEGLIEEARRIRMEMRSAFPAHPLLHKGVSNEGL